PRPSEQVPRRTALQLEEADAISSDRKCYRDLGAISRQVPGILQTGIGRDSLCFLGSPLQRIESCKNELLSIHSSLGEKAQAGRRSRAFVLDPAVGRQHKLRWSPRRRNAP